MVSFFHFFTQKLRLSNPWRYKVPLLITFCYFLLVAGDVTPYVSALSFFSAIVTTIGFMGFGYLTNDLADRKKDALAGKSNGTANLSSTSVVFLVIAFLATAILPWFYLPMDKVSIICILAELGLFVLYAFPPFRLKERGIWGVIADALYAHVVPGFLASWTFYLIGDKSYDDFVYFIVTLCTWQLFSGVRNIVSHHFKDFENDQVSGTKTFATQIGKDRIYTLMTRMFIPLEAVAAIAFFAIVQMEIGFLFVVVGLFLMLALGVFRNDDSDTRAKHFTNTFLDTFYIHWFPYVVIFTLFFRNTNFWWLLVFHILIFHPALGRLFRRLTAKMNASNTLETPVSYAILSTNRNQYSETFIQSHFRLISNPIVYSDGYFPTSVSLDRGTTWRELTGEKDAESRLIKSWKENNVRTVLAEYGPAGVEVMESCKKANVPLVVHFHGFDAYRDDILNHYGEKYEELFQVASKIVVVSTDMKEQLVRLGCPHDRIEFIPYGIDCDVFFPSSSAEKREHFIACGRFVAKKSPLNTLRAFAKVVEVHPNARLTFVGDGELFDAALELAEKLNLSKQVDFKGVLNQDEVAAELQKHAIFVQHSIRTDQNDSEGTPLAILEAASTGLAIVSTKHAGISDVIQDGESGFLVDEGDVQAMSECMLQLLGDKQLRQQLGAKARATVLKNYSQSKYISQLQQVLEEAEIPPQKESKWNVWRKRIMVFVVLFILAEVALRIVGYKPGVLEDVYFHRGKIEYDSLLYADEVGITHVVQGAQMITGGEVNSEGFFSTIEFTPESIDAIRKSGKKIVMLIGDSYTQGCCADNFDKTFAEQLNQSDEWTILNFGIPGADPVQYRLIVEKYAPQLKPDLIVIAVYGGNDILEYNRTAKPFIPLTYPIKNGPWLNSEGPIHLTEQGTYFKNFEEAKAHYLDYFSLWGQEATFFEKTIRYSVILSRPYMKWKTRKRFEEIKYQMPDLSGKLPYSKQNLEILSEVAEKNQIPVVYSLIPSPSDLQSKLNLRNKYGFIFGELNYRVPTNLILEDYDGITNANHFNSLGHKKYARFLRILIETRLSE